MCSWERYCYYFISQQINRCQNLSKFRFLSNLLSVFFPLIKSIITLCLIISIYMCAMLHTEQEKIHSLFFVWIQYKRYTAFTGRLNIFLETDYNVWWVRVTFDKFSVLSTWMNSVTGIRPLVKIDFSLVYEILSLSKSTRINGDKSFIQHST